MGGLLFKPVLSPAAGHVTNCTGGVWHPVEKTTALTSSEDGTLRVWDVMEVQQKTVIKPQVCGAGESCLHTTSTESTSNPACLRAT